MPKSLSFQLLHSDERLLVFALRASVLGLISSMRLDKRKDNPSVESAQPGQFCMQSLRPVFYPLYRGTIKDLN